MKSIPIKDWASDEKPREKLLKQGAQTLANSEILAILISTGTREMSAVELARLIMEKSGNDLNNLGRLGVHDLTKIKGIGLAKAITIVAALELGRRRKMDDTPKRKTVLSSNDVFECLSPYLTDLNHEEFWVCFLNRANHIIEVMKVSQGGVTGTVIDNKIILKKALDILAVSIILCHNHPSGNINPSEQDKRITSKISKAAEYLDIRVLDHLIIAGKKYISFADEGIMPEQQAQH